MGVKTLPPRFLELTPIKYVVRRIGLLRKNPMITLGGRKVDDAAGRIGLIDCRRVEDY